jgi:hypothetical protein
LLASFIFTLTLRLVVNGRTNLFLVPSILHKPRLFIHLPLHCMQDGQSWQRQLFDCPRIGFASLPLRLYSPRRKGAGSSRSHDVHTAENVGWSGDKVRQREKKDKKKGDI